jgi:nucleoside 2-deoxyribosyltransferase
MKIMICGSMTFSKEMIKTKEILEEMGHLVTIPTDAFDIVNGDHNHDDLEADYNHCIENDIMRTHFKFVEESDAVLVLNHDKNNIKGYIGTATLMEVGLAHYFHKKIFLLQELPHHSEHRWTHEVRIMQPVVLNGDFSKIQ